MPIRDFESFIGPLEAHAVQYSRFGRWEEDEWEEEDEEEEEEEQKEEEEEEEREE